MEMKELHDLFQRIKKGQGFEIIINTYADSYRLTEPVPVTYILPEGYKYEGDNEISYNPKIRRNNWRITFYHDKISGCLTVPLKDIVSIRIIDNPFERIEAQLNVED